MIAKNKSPFFNFITSVIPQPHKTPMVNRRKRLFFQLTIIKYLEAIKSTPLIGQLSYDFLILKSACQEKG
ncbi:hypothetical protein EAY03_23760 [Vibrio anguillarum]|nr:hypothetical protein [Vibrio anguillarum]MBF4312784.1 hypothetical protein [Vibrio anguillarum]